MHTEQLPAGLNQYTLTGLISNKAYSFKIASCNEKGQSEQSGVVYQYSAGIASGLLQPQLIVGTRTQTTIGIQMFAPGESTTDVLGY